MATPRALSVGCGNVAVLLTGGIALIVVCLVIGVKVQSCGNAVEAAYNANHQTATGSQPQPMATGVEARQSGPGDIVTFLQGVSSSMKLAEDACFMATQCGYVEEAPRHGEVTSTRRVAPCLKERLAKCEVALAIMREVPAPSRIAEPWRQWLWFSVERNHNQALLLQRTIATSDLPPTLRANGDTLSGVLDWAAARGNADAAAFRNTDVIAQSDAANAAGTAILAQMPGVCLPTTNCTIDKIMGGGPMDVAPAYWRQR